jgi:GNAT superfamily N-acetyltransferase
MNSPEGAPDWLEAVTAAERPDLWQEVTEAGAFAGVWPEYNHHGNHTHEYFGALFPAHAPLQVLFVDRHTGGVVARGRTIPFRWDGTLADLPAGIDAVGRRAVAGTDVPTALSALAAEVDPRFQGGGLSALLVRAMKQTAAAAGLAPLVAPVRPSWKDRYPLTPIEKYAPWKREDGLPFDPWMRVHARLGGEILRCEPLSLEITAPVGEWEAWTKMRFPEDGGYVFPGGLAPLEVKDAVGFYHEPNVWMLHDVD